MTRKAHDSKSTGPDSPVLARWARNLAVETGVVLADLQLSPRDLAAAAGSGTMELDDPARRTVFLRAGGVLIGEGRLVRKGGKTCFELTRKTGSLPLVPPGQTRPVLWQPENWTTEDPEFTGLGKVWSMKTRRSPDQAPETP